MSTGKSKRESKIKTKIFKKNFLINKFNCLEEDEVKDEGASQLF